MKNTLIALLLLSSSAFADEHINFEDAAADGSNIQGSYIAKFNTLNPHVVGSIPGSAHIRRRDDKIGAFVRLFAGSPSIGHFQNVHAGSRCPTMADDTNLDGYLDYPEVMAVVGPVVIPLDEDIASQSGGNRIWPKSFENGSYDYMKEAKFKKFWKDLKSKDKDQNDNMIKLGKDEGLSIMGSVLIIQGVSESKNLPASVKPRNRYKAWQTLPIVCAVFNSVFQEPGTIYVESIPGPIAPVEIGQDTGTQLNPGQINPTEEPRRRPRWGRRDEEEEAEEERAPRTWRWPWET